MLDSRGRLAPSVGVERWLSLLASHPVARLPQPLVKGALPRTRASVTGLGLAIMLPRHAPRDDRRPVTPRRRCRRR